MNHVMMKMLSSLCVLCVATSALADATPYGDFVGANVTFTKVTESSGTDDQVLYGAPVDPAGASDALVFGSLTFTASTEDLDVDLTDGTLTFGVKSNGLTPISTLAIDERGDYTLGSTGGKTAVGAGIAVFVRVIELDGVGVTPINIAGDIAPNQQFTLEAFEVVGPIEWEGGAMFDVGQALADKGIDGGATRLLVSLNNVLFSIGEDGTESNIAKKDFSVNVEVVPEPSAAVLLLIGMVLVLQGRPGARGRRRDASVA